MSLINTERELAGDFGELSRAAEEGAGELERAIGKAKAMARNFRRLARQLARARKGMRQFRLAHPQAGSRGNCGLTSASSVEPRIADCGLSHRSDPTDRTDRTDPTDLHQGGLTAPGSPGESGRISSSAADPPADRRPAGMAEESGLESGLSQDSAMSGPDEGNGGSPGTVEEGGDGGEGPPAAEQAPEAAAEPVTMAWDAAAARRELAGMVREALEARETGRSPGENSAEAEGRLAALEQRLNRLESRANLNRDGG